jgi:hypothetical protein
MLRGSGKVVTETRRVDKFNAVTLVTGGSVQIERTGTTGVTVTADDNLISMFTTEVKAGTLHLAFTPGKSFHGTSPIYKVTVADLRSIEVKGIGDATASKLADDRLAVSIPGQGSVKLTGSVNELAIDIGGSGSAEAGSLKAKRVKVTLGGAGSADVNATEGLDVRISGVGSVSYTGSPRVTQNITGVGSLEKK